MYLADFFHGGSWIELSCSRLCGLSLLPALTMTVSHRANGGSEQPAQPSLDRQVILAGSESARAELSLLGGQIGPRSSRVRPRIVSLNLFNGPLHRGPQHLKYVRAVKKRREAEKHMEVRLLANAGTANVWNKDVLRVGDHIATQDGVAAELRRRQHVNAYEPEGVLLSAWRCIGRKRVDRQGIRGSTHTMAMTCTTASALCIWQDEWVSETFASMVSGAPGLAITRAYDATPMRVRFGAMADKVSPYARYKCRTRDNKG